MMQTLLIEDEIPAARRLSKMLNETRPGIRILDTLDSVESAVRWFRTFPMPDLVFMDIQIADGLSFDIFRQVEIQAPVIFTTAFDQYAVQAFKVSAVDYLLKPIDQKDLEKALIKYEQQSNKKAPLDIESLAKLLRKETYKERFLVKNGALLAFIAASDIAYFRSADGLTQAFTFNGKKYFIENSLEELETLLDPKDFFRIGRGMTIRLNALQKIHPHLNGRLKLELSPALSEDVFVSRERAGDFKSWLGA
ncbi:MAG: response regulator transcription factor [Chitinophagales bacterium]|nr:response regulator transcription factor [Chitinophagales bacterium]